MRTSKAPCRSSFLAASLQASFPFLQKIPVRFPNSRRLYLDYLIGPQSSGHQ